MKFLLYFVSFGSVFALFASVIAGTFWVLTKFLCAWGRFFRALIVRRKSPNVATMSLSVPPTSLKRAGQ